MGITGNTRGLDKLSKQINELSKRAEALDGEHQVPVKDFLNDRFVAKCSRFESVDELFEASGFKIESAEDFKAIPDAEWDAFICSHTSYGDWKSMLSAASAEWAKKQLGL